MAKKRKRQFLNQGATPVACAPCVPDAKTTTCADTCGDVTNNCGTVVDCGSCDCNPPCGECFRCDSVLLSCEPETPGTPCGVISFCENSEFVQRNTCDGNGTCDFSGPIPCFPFACVGSACATNCSSDADCSSNGYCNNEALCVPRGGPGADCENDGQCGDGTVCCSNVCGACCLKSTCEERDPAAPICQNYICVSCADNPTECPNGTCCNSSTQECVADCPGNQLCAVDNICTAPCESHAGCGGNQLCVAGICQPCDAFPGSPASLQNAITSADPGSKLYVCPGLYAPASGENAILIDKSITIIGAGDGAGETRLQGIVDVDGTANAGQQVTLRDLRVLTVGFGVRLQSASLLMERCTVRRGASQGIGIANIAGSLEMRQSAIVDITTGAQGGAIQNSNGSVLLRGCRLEGNTAAQGAGIFTGSTQAQIPSSVELPNTEVRGNTANSQVDPRGAGILNFNGTSTVTISDDSIICDNDPIASQCDGVADTSWCLVACPDQVGSGASPATRRSTQHMPHGRPRGRP